ncbi:hypothetical protein C8R43DRAFT_940664 [Mycena crocata]|nr:hypothetical protein C8R43DRAFT_940664 [Mycena crocata]
MVSLFFICLLAVHTARATVLPPDFTAVIVAATSKPNTTVPDDAYSREGLVQSGPDGTVFASNDSTVRPFVPHPEGAVGILNNINTLTTHKWSIHYAPDRLRTTESYVFYCNQTGNSTRLATGYEKSGRLATVKVGPNSPDSAAGDVRELIVEVTVFRTSGLPGPHIPVLYYTLLDDRERRKGAPCLGSPYACMILRRFPSHRVSPGLNDTQMFAIVIYPVTTGPFVVENEGEELKTAQEQLEETNATDPYVQGNNPTAGTGNSTLGA